MRYLVITDLTGAFLTNWFSIGNDFDKGLHMIVFDLLNEVYCDNGKDWKKIERDSL